MQVETKRVEKENFEELKKILRRSGLDAKGEFNGTTLTRLEVFRHGGLAFIITPGTYGGTELKIPEVKKQTRWVLHGTVLAGLVRVFESFKTEEEAGARKKALVEEIASAEDLKIEEHAYETDGSEEMRACVSEAVIPGRLQ